MMSANSFVPAPSNLRICGRKRIEFIAEIEDCAKIEADAELMDLVWTNLLSNALKFTPQGGTITAQTSEPEEVMISIKIPGVALMKPGHIFDKFYQEILPTLRRETVLALLLFSVFTVI
ncbi:MAG: sensor histidine kinase [Hydrogeniiclostridium mannosilyticum]